jgi:hypothetical protein
MIKSQDRPCQAVDGSCGFNAGASLRQIRAGNQAYRNMPTQWIKHRPLHPNDALTKGSDALVSASAVVGKKSLQLV